MLPEQTRVNRTIPQDIIAQKAGLTPQQLEPLLSLTWANKLTADILHIAPSDGIPEIHIFHLKMTTAILKPDLFRSLDQAIPYATLYEVHYEGRKQYWMTYKEMSTLKSSYYHTKWLKETDSFLTIEGETMADVYRHFFHLITNGQVIQSTAATMDDAIKRQQHHDKLQKRIDALTNKLKKEKQFNKQLALREERQRLMAEMEEER